MTSAKDPLHHQYAGRRRALLDTVAVGLPVMLAVAVLAWRVFDVWVMLGATIAGLAIITLAALRRARRFDRGWLIGALDARLPALQDSSALLFAEAGELQGLAALQRNRLLARVSEIAAIDLRPAWSRRWMVCSAGVSSAVIAAVVLWPSAELGAVSGDGASRPVSSLLAPRITSTRLRITPPAYTGLAVVEQSGLDVRIPEGSRVEWSIGLAQRPATVGLTFPGEAGLALARNGDAWAGGRTFSRSALYRVDAAGLARQRLHRLEVVPDAAPVVRILTPDSQLILASPSQSRWTPVFEASDDYGVDDSATLHITLTKGEGENVTSVERAMSLRGHGDARRKRYSATLDMAREGMVAGSDLIVRLVVTDNRAAGRHTVEGPSVILRWPTDLGLADGLDGMARQVMPAYFRSQRQIIIDAEALIARRSRIGPDQFVDQSNVLGGDQAQLRLRYGQFMGEEAEGGGGGLALPTNDAPAPTAKPKVHEDHPGHHDHEDDAGSATFGQMTDVVAKYGHAHDSGDAATLFDPGTRSTLSLALDAMWSSERALRQGKPQDALPHAHRALELLKTAQQASRIFLARTAPKLPPIDLSRRLGGKRDGISAGAWAPVAKTPADTPAAQAWRALGETPGTRQAVPLRLDALERWARANPGRLTDPLALSAAIDTVRNEPACLDCRRKLRALLWAALERPAAGIQRRAPPSTIGRRYLDALR